MPRQFLTLEGEVPRRRDGGYVKKLFTYLAIAILTVSLVLALWPYQLVASPRSTVRVVNDRRQPVSGLRVVRSWNTSEGQKGQEEATTGSEGGVSFEKVAVSMNLLKRLTKPLLIFVPASCGPGWEVYGHSEFDIYWPDGYTLKFDKTAWERKGEVCQNRDGICIRDPDIIKQGRHDNYVDPQSCQDQGTELALFLGGATQFVAAFSQDHDVRLAGWHGLVKLAFFGR